MSLTVWKAALPLELGEGFKKSWGRISSFFSVWTGFHDSASLAPPPAEVHRCLDRSEGARQVPASARRPKTVLLELSWRGRMYFSTEKYEVQFVPQNFVGKHCGI